MRPARLTLLAAIVVASGCAAEPRTGAGGWTDGAPLHTAVDTNADPTVVELDLVAAPMRWSLGDGRAIDGLAYNGSVPGPVIEAHVGDTLVVHFRNDLDEPTTIHWHGIRLPNEMDGAPHSQAPVPPGGTFEYRFTLEDAGTFWYHPHANEPEQMERGLYGAIVVRGDDEPTVDAETLVVLDDLTLNPDGTLAPFGGLLESHGGREGETQIVNGVVTPTVRVRTGERQRWRIVNAGSARIYRLALPGHSFLAIGSDGGRWTAPVSMDELYLAPGDRMDVVVDIATSPGETTTLTAEPYSRGHGQGVFAAIDVVHLLATNDPPLPALPPITDGRVIAPIDVTGITPTQVTFSESIDTTTGTVSFFVNGESYPSVTPVPATVGHTQVWDLVNMSEMIHPFHLHGFFFQVVERDGVPNTTPTWEDTIELRGMEHVRVAFLPDDRTGMWMFHCHILEHVAGGMMGVMELSR
jgi:FtsP/CotA-like multicopper oxidase with cupredoxin domain